METYVVLEKALGEIERKENWCSGLRERDGGAVCAIGALERAVYGHVSQMGERHHDGLDPYALPNRFGLGDYLPEKYQNEGFTGLSSFNDDEGHAAIVALFQEAIRNEKQKAGVAIELPTREEVAA